MIRAGLWVLWGIAVLQPYSGFAQGPETHYDEIHDENGNVRSHYHQVYANYEKLSPKQKQAFAVNSKLMLSGDNSISPLPTVLTAQENEFLRRGVEQRARALTEFLKDFHSENPRYQAAGIIPDEVMISVLSRFPEDALWMGYLEPAQIRFFYGPDIDRLPDGSFVVTEDSIGPLGGFGDMPTIQKTVEMHSALNSRKNFFSIEGLSNLMGFSYYEKTKSVYTAIIDRYRESAQSRVDKNILEGEVGDDVSKIILSDPHLTKVFSGMEDAKKRPPLMVFLKHELSADHEENRLEKILAGHGMKVVKIGFPRSPVQKFVRSLKDLFYFNRLVVEKDGVYLVQERRLLYQPIYTKKTKVGFIFHNHDWLDLDKQSSLFGEIISKNTAQLLFDSPGEASRYSRRSLTPFELSQVKSLSKKFLDQEISVGEFETALGKFFNDADWKRESLIPQLLLAIDLDQVQASTMPGTSFVSDKEFYIYVEKLIRFYLGEEPMLKSIPTRPLMEYASDGKRSISTQMLSDLLNDRIRFVLKHANLHAGEGVILGNKTSTEDWQDFVRDLSESKTAKLDGENFVVQERMRFSVKAGNLTSLRYYADASGGPQGVHVGMVPWGRESPLGGNGKVNISTGGSEVHVMVEKPFNCADTLTEHILSFYHEGE